MNSLETIAKPDIELLVQSVKGHNDMLEITGRTIISKKNVSGTIVVSRSSVNAVLESSAGSVLELVGQAVGFVLSDYGTVDSIHILAANGRQYEKDTWGVL